jgi:hypothetical protein
LCCGVSPEVNSKSRGCKAAHLLFQRISQACDSHLLGPNVCSTPVYRVNSSCAGAHTFAPPSRFSNGEVTPFLSCCFADKDLPVIAVDCGIVTCFRFDRHLGQVKIDPMPRYICLGCD